MQLDEWHQSSHLTLKRKANWDKSPTNPSKYLHIFAQYPTFFDTPQRNKHLVRSPFLSPSHMDDFGRHIVLGHCHCGSVDLHRLCLRSTVPSGHDPSGHDPCGRLTLSAAVSEERKEKGGSTVWSSFWVWALPPLLFVCSQGLNLIATYELFWLFRAEWYS